MSEKSNKIKKKIYEFKENNVTIICGFFSYQRNFQFKRLEEKKRFFKQTKNVPEINKF